MLVVRHHFPIRVGLRGYYLVPCFSQGVHGPNQTVLLLLVLPRFQKYINSRSVFSKQTTKLRIKDKCEPSSISFCHLGMLVPRGSTNCWDVWNGFMWVHGVWIILRGKSLSLCSFHWQAAHAASVTDPLQSIVEEDVLIVIQNCSHNNIIWLV